MDKLEALENYKKARKDYDDILVEYQISLEKQMHYSSLMRWTPGDWPKDEFIRDENYTGWITSLRKNQEYSGYRNKGQGIVARKKELLDLAYKEAMLYTLTDK